MLIPPRNDVDRIVTISDPAWFCTSPRRLKDGSVNPDYGCVFWEVAVEEKIAFFFDKEGAIFCCLKTQGDDQDYICFQGRRFRIAGPTLAALGRGVDPLARPWARAEAGGSQVCPGSLSAASDSCREQLEGCPIERLSASLPASVPPPRGGRAAPLVRR